MDKFISIVVLKFSESKFQLDIRFLSQLNRCIDQSLTILKSFGRYLKLDTESFFRVINWLIDGLILCSFLGCSGPSQKLDLRCLSK